MDFGFGAFTGNEALVDQRGSLGQIGTIETGKVNLQYLPHVYIRALPKHSRVDANAIVSLYKYRAARQTVIS